MHMLLYRTIIVHPKGRVECSPNDQSYMHACIYMRRTQHKIHWKLAITNQQNWQYFNMHTSQQQQLPNYYPNHSKITKNFQFKLELQKQLSANVT